LTVGMGVAGGQFLEVGGDVVALDRGQAQALGVCPGEEPQGVAVIGGARVVVGDLVGEEGKEALGGFLALVGDGGGEEEAAAGG
jgi:hypothetical protein